jgi:hypothetical protein
MAPKRRAPRERVDERVERVEVDIVHQAELRTNARDILTAIRQQRPTNTSQVYEPKQREYRVGIQLGSGLRAQSLTSDRYRYIDRSIDLSTD